VLDFGCGFGHASFLVARALGEANTVCADYSFASLYLARRFFVPDATFVCVDGNGSLPFRDSMYSSILCSDAFHFVAQKRSLAREFERVVRPEGNILMGHLHNKYSPVSSAGAGLSAAGYARLFRRETKLIPEVALVDGYFGDDVVDLETPWSAEQLNASVEGLSLIASGDSTLFRRHAGGFEGSVRVVANPIVNPIYEPRRDGSELLLTKRTSRDFRERVEAKIGSRVPVDYRLNTDYLHDGSERTLKKANAPYLGDLLRRLIAVDAPPRFVT
jgi:SAM-dependent methyltransferase